MSLNPKGCQHDGWKDINAQNSKPEWCGECQASAQTEAVEQQLDGMRKVLIELSEEKTLLVLNNEALRKQVAQLKFKLIQIRTTAQEAIGLEVKP